MSSAISVSAGMKGKVQKAAVRAALSALETVVGEQKTGGRAGGDGKIKKKC